MEPVEDLKKLPPSEDERERESLDLIVDEIGQDARRDADGFLRDSVVPEGGE